MGKATHNVFWLQDLSTYINNVHSELNGLIDQVPITHDQWSQVTRDNTKKLHRMQATEDLN